MRGLTSGAVVMAVVGAGAASAGSVPAPIMSAMSDRMIAWTPADARCEDGPVTFDRAPQPDPARFWGPATADGEVAFNFRVGADGRPLSIRRVGSDYRPGIDDLAPSLAAAHVAAGTARANCTVRFVAAVRSFADAPLDQVMKLTLFERASAPQVAWDRVRPTGSDCFRPAGQAPAPLLRAFPDYAKLPGRPGVREWSMIGHDIDVLGHPSHVHVIAGSGQPALDAAAIVATGQARFVAGARTGCLDAFVRQALPLAAPDAISEDALRPEGATCPRKLPFERQPVLTFPENYRKRSIEGWAIVAYDVAPWGALGNIRVLASEPSTDFGEWAKRVVGNATKPASTTGYVGCIDRVMFRMGKVGEVTPAEPLLLDDVS